MYSLLILSLAVLGPAARADVTGEEAAAVVRSFEKQTGLALKPAVRQDEDGQVLWMLTHADGRSWRVDAKTGQVVGAYYPPVPPAVGLKTQRSAEEVRAVASAYAKAHFPAFMGRRIQEVAPSHDAICYYEMIPTNGARTANVLAIALDLAGGRVRSASLFDDPLPPESARQPVISRDTAVQAAAKAAGITRVYSVPHSLLLWGERLAWSVEIDGSFGNGLAGNRAVVVDAITGDASYVSAPRHGDRPDACDGQCAMGLAIDDDGSSVGVVELTLRPRVHEGAICMPVVFARLFDIAVGPVERPPGEGAHDARVHLDVAVVRLDGEEYVPAEPVLKAAAASVLRYRADPDHSALTILLKAPGPVAQASQLKLARTIKAKPTKPPFPAPPSLPAEVEQPRNALAP